MRDEYIIKESNWVLLLTTPWVILTVSFVIGTVMTWHEGVNTRFMMIGFCVIFGAIGMIIAMATIIRGLQVMDNGKQFIYSTMFGRKRTFYKNDISHIETRYIRLLNWEYYVILDTNGNVLCTLETHMMRLEQLFADLEESGIPVDKI